MGAFQDSVITLVESINMPGTPGLPPFEAARPLEQQTLTPPPEKWNWWKFAAVMLVIVASYVATLENVLSFQFFEFILVMSLVLMFAPQIVDLVHHLTTHDEDEVVKATSVRLEDWIHESLSTMRMRYVSARFLCKVQNPKLENLSAHYKALGVDPAIYSREQFFKETLPHEFVGQLGKIRDACDKNCWARKEVVISAIVASRQAINQAAQHAPGVAHSA
jgi:hypothetical protein